MQYIINGINHSCIGTSLTIDTLVNPGDTIEFHVGMTTSGGCIYPQNGMCNVTFIQWERNGIIVDSCNWFGYCHYYIITDTGSYVIGAWGESCGGSLSPFFLYLNVHYNPVVTNLSEINNENAFYISPSFSSGVYEIKSTGRQLKKIQVTDTMGRSVYLSNEPITEINLTNYSDGVYLYIVQDDKQNIFRGKIVKQ